MHLPERDADCPLLIPEISETIDREIQTFTNPQACDTHEKQSSGFDSTLLAKLITNEKVIFGRKRSGKVFILMREIPANNEVFFYAVSPFVGKVAKTLA
jgi:hypothetical protein